MSHEGPIFPSNNPWYHMGDTFSRHSKQETVVDRIVARDPEFYALPAVDEEQRLEERQLEEIARDKADLIFEQIQEVYEGDSPNEEWLAEITTVLLREIAQLSNLPNRRFTEIILQRLSSQVQIAYESNGSDRTFRQMVEMLQDEGIVNFSWLDNTR